jgi:hypothetical protein
MNIVQGLKRAMALSAIACFATGALADGHSSSVSKDDLAAINKAIGGFGCKAEDAEAEDGGFEVEAAVCENGTYEIELDSEFNVLSLSLATEDEDEKAEKTADASTLENDIMALLATMRCEMDPDDIEVEGDEIELDDVFCGGGQFDINLNSDLHVTGMRGE